MSFRKTLNTEIDIDAPAGRVWEVLTDLEAYPQWNPMIVKASGEIRVGARLLVRFEPAGSRGHTFRPKLLAVKEKMELRWLGWPRFPGFFDTEHYWILSESPGGGTHLVHGTEVYGLFAPLAGKTMVRTSRGPFEAMNRAHKQRAENTSD